MDRIPQRTLQVTRVEDLHASDIVRLSRIKQEFLNASHFNDQCERRENFAWICDERQTRSAPDLRRLLFRGCCKER